MKRERDLGERQYWCQEDSKGKESITAIGSLGKKKSHCARQGDSGRETGLLELRQWRKRQQNWQ